MRIVSLFALIATFVACTLHTTNARAHGMRSIYVEILETAPGRARVSIRSQVPVSGARVVATAPCVLGDGESALLECPSGLAGATLTVEGLGPIVSEAVVWIQRADGSSASHLLTPASPSLVIPASISAIAVAAQYVRLGVAHIATGADHLLFLLALVLCLKRVRAVLLAETAFTLSHSLSFSAAALGWVHVSSAAAEACIALSLVLVALEIGRRRDTDDARTIERRGALLAFVFGLVHGLGFAGGLAEIGLPARAIPAALLGFAGGVEIGQVAFLAIVLALFALARRLRAERRVSFAGAYAVGVIGCFWLFERLRALFPLA